MACERSGIFETIFTNRRQDRAFRRESDHALADIAHRRHVERLAQGACGAPAIGDSDDSRNVDGAAVSVFLQFAKPCQQDGKTGAAAYSDNPHRPSPLRTTPIVLSSIQRSSLSEIFLA